MRAKAGIDPFLLGGTLFLVGLGIVIIYSSSGTYAETQGLSNTFFLVNHIKKLFIGLAALLVGLLVPYKFWERAGRPLLFISILFLIYLVVNSSVQGVHGAKRWLNVGGMGVQPTEFAKIGLILFLAKLLKEKKSVMTSFTKGVIASLIMVGVLFGLVLLQPNYSSAAILLGTALLMIFVAGARISHLVGLGLLGIPALLAILISSPYRMNRVLAFFKPDDYTASSYQTTQSLISLGNGGLFGTGLGTSTQKLGYLPMPFTDTIFSILGEEMGFIGTLICLLTFGLIIWRALRISYYLNDDFASYFTVGAIGSLTITFFMHIGVCTGAFPTTGQPLPFVSYGGTSLIVSLLMIGIILNFSSEPSLFEEKKEAINTPKNIHLALARQRMGKGR